MLRASRNRHARVDRSRIRGAVMRSIAEEEPVAGLAAHIEAERGEAGLAAVIIFVQINEEREHPLLVWSDAGKSVVMLVILLARGVAEHLQRLARANICAARSRKPAVEGVDRGILFGERESRTFRRADRIWDLMTGPRVDDNARLQQRFGRLDQIGAFGLAEEPGEKCNFRGIAELFGAPFG